MRKMLTAAAIAFPVAAGPALAQSSPVGLWKTIDDETRQEKSFVRIVEVAGVLVGKIERIVNVFNEFNVDVFCFICHNLIKHGQTSLSVPPFTMEIPQN